MSIHERLDKIGVVVITDGGGLIFNVVEGDYYGTSFIFGGLKERDGGIEYHTKVVAALAEDPNFNEEDFGVLTQKVLQIYLDSME